MVGSIHRYAARASAQRTNDLLEFKWCFSESLNLFETNIRCQKKRIESFN